MRLQFSLMEDSGQYFQEHNFFRKKGWKKKNFPCQKDLTIKLSYLRIAQVAEIQMLEFIIIRVITCRYETALKERVTGLEHSVQAALTVPPNMPEKR